jgi:predicted transcriptional regulator
MCDVALGELERAVMAQLWAAPGALTVREVHDRLERELAYTTVMTVLGRLAKKGVVRQERDGKAYRYAAASTREQLAASLMLDALGDVGEDRTAALVAFVDRVGPEEVAALRAALEDAPAPAGTPLPEVPEPRVDGQDTGPAS